MYIAHTEYPVQSSHLTPFKVIVKQKNFLVPFSIYLYLWLRATNNSKTPFLVPPPKCMTFIRSG